METIFFILFILILFSIYFIYKKKQIKVQKLIYKARTNSQLYNFEKSISFYNEALKLSPNNSYLHSDIGWIKIYTRQIKEAEFHFSKAITLNKNNYEAHTGMMIVISQQKRFQKLLDYCNSFIKKDSAAKIPMIYAHKASAFIGLKKYKEALETLNIIKKLNPEFPLLNCCLAEVYCYLGFYEKALKAVNQYFENDLVKDNQFQCNIIYLWQGWAYYGLSNFSKAQEKCDYYLDIEKDEYLQSPKAFEILGLIYKYNDNIPLALLNLEKALKIYKREKLKKEYEEVYQHIQQIKE